MRLAFTYCSKIGPMSMQIVPRKHQRTNSQLLCATWAGSELSIFCSRGGCADHFAAPPWINFPSLRTTFFRGYVGTNNLRKSRSSHRSVAGGFQGCQISLGSWYQNRKKRTKWSLNIPNVRKIFQMAIKYISIFQSKALQNLPKLLKRNHLATLVASAFDHPLFINLLIFPALTTYFELKNGFYLDPVLQKALHMYIRARSVGNMCCSYIYTSDICCQTLAFCTT
jgi:hypothetical protein